MSTANVGFVGDNTTEKREKLKSHMLQYSGSSYVQGWDELWNKGDFLPWDRGSPSPALADTLVHHAQVIGGPIVDGRRKRALVPGCGRGVDVLLLASFGYDVVGLEYAEKALVACEKYVKENEGRYAVYDEKVGKGKMKFLRGDFYSDEWAGKIGWEGWDGKFDLIYDYTVSALLLCSWLRCFVKGVACDTDLVLQVDLVSACSIPSSCSCPG